MPDKRNCKRQIQVKFFINEKELGMTKTKMAEAEIINMSVYIRKMVIDGYVVKPEFCCSLLLMVVSAIFQMEIGGNCRLFCSKAK